MTGDEHVGTDRQFATLNRALGLALDGDPKFAANAQRIAHRDEMVRLLEARLADDGRDHWLAIMHEAGVPAAPVNSVAEAFTDPVLLSRMVVEAEGVPQVRSPLRLDDAPLHVASAPPALGRDTAAILTNMGVPQDLIGSWHDRGVVRLGRPEPAGALLRRCERSSDMT